MVFGFTHQRTFDTRVRKGKNRPDFLWSFFRYDGKSRAPKRSISKAWQRNVDRDAVEGTTPLNFVSPLVGLEEGGGAWKGGPRWEVHLSACERGRSWEPLGGYHRRCLWVRS